MLRLNKLYGYTIIEVVCALMLISVLLPLVFKIQLLNVKLHRGIELKENKVAVLEAVANELYYNCSYNEIINLIATNKKYINEENLTLNNLYEKDITKIMVENIDKQKLGLEIQVEMDEVLKITLQIKYKFYGKEERITCTFSKGDY